MSSTQNVPAQEENPQYTCEFCATPVGEDAVGIIHRGYHTEFCSWLCVSGRALRAIQAHDFVQSELIAGLQKQVRELETGIAYLRAGVEA